MICSKCGKETARNGFATYRKQSGELGRRGVCKACRGKHAIDNFEYLQKWRKDYNKNNRTKKRQNDAYKRAHVKSVVDTLKEETPCADCGNKFPAVAMDFDHVHGKNKSIANLVGGAYKLEIILAEIALCEIVCACCHRIRTHERKQNHAPSRTDNINLRRE